MDIFKSKKFEAALVGVTIVIIANFIPEIDEADLTKIVGLIMTYIFGQGLADFGKEAKSK